MGNDDRNMYSFRVRQSVINVLSDIPKVRKKFEQYAEELARIHAAEKLEEDTVNATDFSELL